MHFVMLCMMHVKSVDVKKEMCVLSTGKYFSILFIKSQLKEKFNITASWVPAFLFID